MAIGVVDDSDFEKELNKHNPSVSIPRVSIPSTEIIDVTRGRPKNSLEVPDSLRQIIGETNETEGRQDAVQLARNFGISPSSVSAYANGATSTATYDDAKPSIKNHINAAKERISKRAQFKLHAALNGITKDKLATAPLAVIASVAKSMSGIIKDMEPAPNAVNPTNSPTFVFYAPQPRKEENFDVIVVKE